MRHAKTPVTTWLVLTALILYLGGFVVYWMLVESHIPNAAEAGQFGDMFGGFNAFVSGLAMLGVVGAILLQRQQNQMQSEELRLQREELELTRKELRGQKEVLEKQYQQQRRTSEAALMQQLINEYDGLRGAIARVTAWKRQQGDDAVRIMREAVTHTGHITPELYNIHQPAKTANEHRHSVSRFFVRVRRLAQAGYIPEDLVALSLERSAVDVFLTDVDPLDEAVAGDRYSDADRRFYLELLTNRYVASGESGSRVGPDPLQAHLQLELPNLADALIVRRGSFDVEDRGEDEDGNPDFDYGDGEEMWRARIRNVGATTLTSVSVRVVGLIPPTTSSWGMMMDSMLPVTLLSLPTLAAGDSHTFDLLVHSHGSQLVSLPGDDSPPFWVQQTSLTMTLRASAAEDVPPAIGRVEIRGQGPHNAVMVSAV